MADLITPDAISTILANPNSISDPVVQVVDLTKKGKIYRFSASDGKQKVRGAFGGKFTIDIDMGSLQNFGLIRLVDYVVNLVSGSKCLIVNEMEIVTPFISEENKPESEQVEPKITPMLKEDVGIQLKPKKEVVAKSAAEVVHEQNVNMAPSARMATTRRVYPIVALNPYNGNWTIKARVTNKGELRSYNTAKGEGQVFNVELTDQDGTQIQATMFNEAATKFDKVFKMGKVYYISKGSIRVANKKFKTVENAYEMSLNENSMVEEVEEINGQTTKIPDVIYNFVQIDQLTSYVNAAKLVDVIGVVQNVYATVGIKRKSDETEIPKRDILIADDSNKTVVVSLWNKLAETKGSELWNAFNDGAHPIIAIKSLKVGDYNGVSLSTLSRSTVTINPDVPESKKLKSWYESEGKGATMEHVGAGLGSNSPIRSMYTERVVISDINSNPSLGDGKPAFFSLKAYTTYIKPDQAMWYRACKTCNKKVVDGSDRCENCSKECESSLRYAMSMVVKDHSGQFWVTLFNDQAEKVLGYSADDLNILKETNDGSFKRVLDKALFVPHVFRIGVQQTEFNHEKRQRIQVKSRASIDFVAESQFLLKEIEKMEGSATAVAAM